MITNTSLSFADLGEALTATQESAWHGLLASQAAISRQLDTSLRAAHHLGLSAYEVLLRLALAPNYRMKMSELAAVAPLTLSGISRMVDRLEREGLVKREADEQDGRVACATLTHAGLERLRAAHLTYLAGVRRLFLAHLSEADLEALSACWAKLGGCA